LSAPFSPGCCLVRQTDGSTAILWVQQHQLPSRHAWVIAGRSPEDCASIETCAFLADQVEFVEQMLIRRMPGVEPVSADRRQVSPASPCASGKASWRGVHR